MRKTLLITFFVICACNTNNQTEHHNSDDLNGLRISPKIITDISKMVEKQSEKNSVIRYEESDSSSMVFKPYDSIVAGIKFKFVNEKLAYDIIKKHFKNVKKSNNYLYLTNMDFDNSGKIHFDIVIAPVSNQLELIKLVGTSPVNYDLTNHDVVEWFKKSRLNLISKL